MGIELAGGKDMFTIQGEYSANMIRKAFGLPVAETASVENAPGRPPLLCAGCPHRGIFHVLSKLKTQFLETSDVILLDHCLRHRLWMHVFAWELPLQWPTDLKRPWERPRIQ